MNLREAIESGNKLSIRGILQEVKLFYSVRPEDRYVLLANEILHTHKASSADGISEAVNCIVEFNHKDILNYNDRWGRNIVTESIRYYHEPVVAGLLKHHTKDYLQALKSIQYQTGMPLYFALANQDELLFNNLVEEGVDITQCAYSDALQIYCLLGYICEKNRADISMCHSILKGMLEQGSDKVKNLIGIDVLSSILMADFLDDELDMAGEKFLDTLELVQQYNPENLNSEDISQNSLWHMVFAMSPEVLTETKGVLERIEIKWVPNVCGFDPMDLALAAGRFDVAMLLQKSCPERHDRKYSLFKEFLGNKFFCLERYLDWLNIYVQQEDSETVDSIGNTLVHKLLRSPLSLETKIFMTGAALVLRPEWANQANMAQETPLYIAADVEDSGSLISLLLRHGAKDRVNNYGGTALHRAIDHGLERWVQPLINNGSPVNACNEYGATALHLACKNGHLGICKQLLQQGAKSSLTKMTCMKSTAILLALHMGHLSIVKYLIDGNFYNVNGICNLNNEKLLEHAISLGQKDAVDYLLGAGAYLMLCSNLKEHFLQAVSNNHYEIVRMVLERAKLESMHCELLNIEHPINVLSAAVLSGNPDMIALFSNNHTVQSKDEGGYSPLHAAVLNDDLEVVKTIIKQGGEIDDVSKDGVSVLQLATKSGSVEVVRYLLKHLKSKRKIVSLFDKTKNFVDSVWYSALQRRDNTGQTVLHAASECAIEEPEKFSCLWQDSKDILGNTTDNDGMTPLMRLLETIDKPLSDYDITLQRNTMDYGLLLQTFDGKPFIFHMLKADKVEHNDLKQLLKFIPQKSLMNCRDDEGNNIFHVLFSIPPKDKENTVYESYELLRTHAPYLSLTLTRWLVAKLGTTLLYQANSLGQLPIQYAARASSIETFEWALKFYPKSIFIRRDKLGRNLLMDAAQGLIANLQLVLNHTPKSQWLISDNTKRNILHHFWRTPMSRYRYSLLKYLLDATKAQLSSEEFLAFINQKDIDGNTPFHSLLKVLIEPHEFLPLLLDYGASAVINQSNNDGDTPLHLVFRAAGNIDDPAVVHNGTEDSPPKGCGLEKVQLLMRSGAESSLQKKNKKGELPLHVLCQNAHGNVNTKNFEEYYDYFYVISFMKQEITDSNGKALGSYLYGVNEPDNQGNTPLHYLAEGERWFLIPYLRSNGARVDIKNKEGVTPRQFAAINVGERHEEGDTGDIFWYKPYEMMMTYQDCEENDDARGYQSPYY